MISKEIFKKEWFLLEVLRNYPPLHLATPLLYLSSKESMGDFGFKPILHSVHEYKEGMTRMIFPTDEWHDSAEAILQGILEDPEVLNKCHRISDEKYVPAVKDWSKKILATDLSKFSNEDLHREIKTWIKIGGDLHFMRCFGWNMETAGEHFSKYLINYLTKVVEKSGKDYNPVLTFSTLTTPTKHSLGAAEHIDLLVLAKKVKDGEVESVENDKNILDHVDKYGFLPYGCIGPAWSARDVIKHIDEILNSGIDINLDKQIADQQALSLNTETQQKKIYAELDIDKKHKDMLNLAKDLVFQKAWSKEHQFLSWYALDSLLKELAKRVYATAQQIRCLLPHEFEAVFKNMECDIDELNKRYKHGLLCIDGPEAYFLNGKDAQDTINNMNLAAEEEVDKDIKEFVGQPAVPGSATGVVKVVNGVEEMSKMNQGDILVSEMTIPEIVNAMKKAAAIVTDMGGITCHAAIVSRELGTPCVIGTKVATKVLKDGDKVEVDASNGIVRKV